MSGDKKIFVPGTDNPGTLAKVLEALVEQQRVATVIVRRGERFILKLVEMRKEVVIGEVRCLHWSAEMSRKIYQSAAYRRTNASPLQRIDILNRALRSVHSAQK